MNLLTTHRSAQAAQPPERKRHRARCVGRVSSGRPVAVAAVAIAAFTGITTWGTHQERVNTKAFYCSFVSDPATNPEEKELVDQLDC